MNIFNICIDKIPIQQWRDTEAQTTNKSHHHTLDFPPPLTKDRSHKKPMDLCIVINTVVHKIIIKKKRSGEKVTRKECRKVENIEENEDR